MKINLPVTEKERVYHDGAEIISTTNIKGAIRSVNDDFLNIAGYVEEEVVGKNHNIIRHPDMPPEAYADLWSTLKSGSPWMGVVKNRCKNGNHYWVDAFVSPMYEDGVITGYQSVRVKPKQEWVDRAAKLYKKVMAGKSENDKRRSTISAVKLKKFPLGIAEKLTLAFILALVPVLAFVGLVGGVSPLMLLAALPLSAVIAYGAIRVVMKPLLQMAKESKTVADNPLAQYIYTGLTDEVGQLMYALRFSQAKLRTAIGRVRESSDVLIKSASEIASGNADLSQRTEEQASSLEETASSMEEMTSSVNQSADNAHQANQLSSEAGSQAAQGGTVVKKAVVAMSEISTASKKIADIIGVIDEIAFQTNLLALNAAVEAARAGEQGRGFAVVAGEVRTLAGRSAEAAKEIKDLIQDSVVKVEQGTNLVNESGKTLEEIVNSVKKVTDIVSEISASSQEQASGISEVNTAVMQMDQMTQQNSALVEQSAAASLMMEEKTKVLAGLALQFRLEDK